MLVEKDLSAEADTVLPSDFAFEVCTSQDIYGGKTASLKFIVPHFIIPMDSGNGRTHLTKEIAGIYSVAGVLDFSSRERFLEFTLDGTVLYKRATTKPRKPLTKYSVIYNCSCSDKTLLAH